LAILLDRAAAVVISPAGAAEIKAAMATVAAAIVN
jgi:hypothetical protein